MPNSSVRSWRFPFLARIGYLSHQFAGLSFSWCSQAGAKWVPMSVGLVCGDESILTRLFFGFIGRTGYL